MNMTPADETHWIIETTADTFEQDVIERSRQVPVVVDFWADWCQPCRLLAPLLEKLAREYQGRFILVKANTDQLQQAAAQFGVQSLPTVIGLRDGQPVDYFTGLIPEPNLRSWIDRLLPTETERLAQEAQQLESVDEAAAIDKYREALAVDSENAPAKIGLARVLLAQGDLDACAALVAELEARGYLEPAAQQVKAALDLQRQGASSGSIEECRQAVEQDPDNLELQLRLAEALAAQQQYREALQISLSLVERDRHGVGETARQRMVDVFRLLEDEQPELVSEYRRQLSAALY